MNAIIKFYSIEIFIVFILLIILAVVNFTLLQILNNRINYKTRFIFLIEFLFINEEIEERIKENKKNKKMLKTVI